MPRPEDIPIIGDLWEAATPEEKDDIPIFGDVWRAQHAVVDFYEFGCFPEYIVWLQTLTPCIGQLIIDILSFGYGDILRGYFRPIGARGLTRVNRAKLKAQGRTANERAKNRPRFQIPEIGNEIGKSLPGGTFFRGRKVTNAEAYFWQIDGLVQRGLWYWLLADITADFIICWTTGIMESEACARPPAYKLLVKRAGPLTVFTDLWSVLNTTPAEVEEPDGIWDEIQKVDLHDDAVSMVVLKARFTTITGVTMGGELGLFPVGGGMTPFARSGWPIQEDDDPDSISLIRKGVKGPFLVKFKTIGPQAIGQIRDFLLQVAPVETETV